MEKAILKEAQEYLNAERFNETIDFVLQQLKSNPDNIDLLMLLGKGYFKMQKFGEAKNIFNQILNLDGENKEAFVYIELIERIITITRNYYFENTYTDDQLYV